MDRIRTLICAGVALAAVACVPTTGLGNGNAATATDAIALKSTTALSLAELAYNSGEAAATAAVQSHALTLAQDAAIGSAIHRALTYRDEARMMVAAGGDASGAIESLDGALGEVDNLTHPAQK